MIGWLLGPLVRGATYRRGVYLLLGAVLALPYVLVVAAFAHVFMNQRSQRLLVVLVIAIVALIVAVPPFLTGTRALEIAAVRWLLQVDLPDPQPTMDRDTRVRSALWFTLHLVFGGSVGAALVVAIPLALASLTRRGGELLLGAFSAHHPMMLSLLGLAVLLAGGYAVTALGALAAAMAPALLGPSADERIAALEAHAAQLAERNRLARELHDSIGHALTVTTVQAAAASELLDIDTEFARRALVAIEGAGRIAMDELDRVLGILRDGKPKRRSSQPTLDDLDHLVQEARSAGIDVSLAVHGSVTEVPASASREGYRIIQESLTNALRHAGQVPITLSLTVRGGVLMIEAANPTTDEATGSGRGLIGMRECVALLGGTMIAGPDDGQWQIRVRLPVQQQP